jgi:hypothetical protein
MTNITQRIKAIDAVSVVQNEGVELKNRSGCCPLHSDTTPSMHVYQDNYIKCYGCGFYGDSVDFIQALYGLDFKYACRYLGIEFSELTPQVRQQIEERKRLTAKRIKEEKREQDLSYTLAFLIRSAYKTKEHITPDNLDEFADTLDSLSWWEFCHEILCTGTTDEKRQCCEGLKDMKTIKRNSIFKPDFDFGKWLRAYNE